MREEHAARVAHSPCLSMPVVPRCKRLRSFLDKCCGNGLLGRWHLNIITYAYCPSYPFHVATCSLAPGHCRLLPHSRAPHRSSARDDAQSALGTKQQLWHVACSEGRSTSVNNGMQTGRTAAFGMGAAGCIADAPTQPGWASWRTHRLPASACGGSWRQVSWRHPLCRRETPPTRMQHSHLPGGSRETNLGWGGGA